VAADHGTALGVPVVFPADLLPEVASVRGDGGARSVLWGYSSRVVTVPMPSAALDIDTTHDLRPLPDLNARPD